MTDAHDERVAGHVRSLVGKVNERTGRESLTVESAYVAVVAAAGSVPGDGGEALRREVERLCDRADSFGVAAVRTSDLRAALSAAAAAVRERREVTHDWMDIDTEVVQGTACRRCGRALPLGQREDGPCIPAPVDRGTAAAPVGGRSQDKQERP